MWERINSLQDTITNGWKEVETKLKHMQKVMKGWADWEFGFLLKKTIEIRRKLRILWNSPYSATQQQNPSSVRRSEMNYSCERSSCEDKDPKPRTCVKVIIIPTVLEESDLEE